MKTKLHKRILSAILALIIVVGYFPVRGTAEEDASAFSVLYEGKTVSSVTFERNEKPVITARGIPEGAEYQWQIQIPGQETWVDIYGQTTENLTLSYALLASIMDNSGAAMVRCAAVVGGVDTGFTDPVQAKVVRTAATVQMQSTEIEQQIIATEPPAVETEPQVIETEPQFIETEPQTIETESETVETESQIIETELQTAEVQTQGFTLLSDIQPQAETNTEAAKEPAAADYGVAPAEETGDTTDTEANTAEYVTITIHYLWADTQTKVFDPYIASLRYGATFAANIPVPTQVGYDAVLSTDMDTVITAVPLNVTDLTENMTLTVLYKPGIVGYSARYFLQNVYNDLYVESRYETGTAETGTYPTAIDIDIPGFTKLYHQPEVVAADGSTEFHCYYDRNYYLYFFDCDGGYGVEPVYARYGTTLVVGTPIRTGYVFEGWDLVSITDTGGNVTEYPGVSAGSHTPYVCIDADSNTLLGNYTYRAVWGRSDATFTVIYWVENADDTDYSYAYSISDVAAKTGDVISLDNIENYLPDAKSLSTGETLDDHVILNDEDTTSVTVEGDGSTIFNIRFLRKKYFIKFYYARSSENSDGTPQYQVANNTGGSSGSGGAYHMASWNNNVSNLKLTLPAADQVDRYTTGNTDDYGDYTYHYFTMKAKYGENIESVWPAAPLTTDGWSFISWGTQYGTEYNSNNSNKNIKGPFSKMDDQLIKKSVSEADYDEKIGAYEAQFMVAYWNTKDVICSWTYNIYVEYVAEIDAGKTITEKDGRKFVLMDVIAPVLSYYTNGPTGQSKLPFEGLKDLSITPDGSNPIRTDNTDVYYAGTVNFYYTRNNRTLQFDNYGDTHKSVAVAYGVPLAAYIEDAGTPAHPDSLEPGAYSFVGWYTGPMGTGQKIDATTAMTMPDDGLILFAYWKPIVHTVEFYPSYKDMTDGTNQIGTTLNKDHGYPLLNNEIPENPVHANGYTFKGWFYQDGTTGEIHAFDPGTMPITQDLKLYAEWKSPTTSKYTIKYVDQETGTEIADPVAGYAYVGMTKTFTAKAFDVTDGGERYYPVSSSSSIVMAENESENVCTFEYVKLSDVAYTVKYWNVTEKQWMDPSDADETVTDYEAGITKTTNAAVLDVKRKYFSGYMEDFTYKQLVLSADAAQNVLIFNYTKDEVHARYVIRHLTEDLEGGTYSAHAYFENIGDIGTTVTEAAMDIKGFAYSVDVTKSKNPSDITVAADGVSGTLVKGDADGLELELYYQRLSYPYTVEYVEYGTSKLLQTITTAPDGSALTGKFEEVVSYTPDGDITVDDISYTLVGSADPRTLRIRADENQKLTVYYQAAKVTVNYIPISRYSKVGGGCSLDSETVANSIYAGSTPVPDNGFYFVGWYTDPSCADDTAVDAGWVDDDSGKLTPVPTGDETLFFYYALFAPINKTLTITKRGAEGTDSSLFRITGMDVLGQTVDMTVVIRGSSSVTIDGLYCGNYTVTELTDWSWKYSYSGVSSNDAALNTENITGGCTFEIRTESPDNVEIIFTNTYNDSDWLNGESGNKNSFGK